MVYLQNLGGIAAKVIEGGERRVLPVDPETMERRWEELEAICMGILMRLSPEERAAFLEYRELMRIQEDRNIQTAYCSEIRTGERRKIKK